MIPVFKPSVTEAEINAVIKVLKSGWWGLGPKTAEFEKLFSQYVGNNYAVALNSGTAALHLALNLLDLKPDDEVIVPTVTFVSTAHAVLYNGAKVVFADVDKKTLCIDTNDVRKKITKHTRAIVPVHYGGHPCDMDELQELVEGRDIMIIEDAAHACGAEYKGKRIGSISTLTCFSFHAVKNLACGEGGMVSTDNRDLYDKLMKIRWLGISKDTWKRSAEEKVYAWHYSVEHLGFKAHLNDLHSAIGIEQLKRLEETNARRREIVGRYNEELGKLDWVETPIEKDDVKSSWHIYHIKVENRDDLINFLKDNDIAPGVHYYPNHLHPYYRKLHASCPNAEEVWQKLISLPLYPDLKDKEVDYIIETVDRFGRRHVWAETRIKSDEVTLRKINLEDLELIRNWRNSDKIRKCFFHQELITEEQQLNWFNEYLKNETDLMFMIETNEGVPIGTLAIYHIDAVNRQAEVGRIMLGNEKYLGKGYAIKALELLLANSFREMDLERIYLEVLDDNERAVGMYDKIGFKTEGIKRKSIMIGKERKDIRIMSILRDEFIKE